MPNNLFRIFFQAWHHIVIDWEQCHLYKYNRPPHLLAIYLTCSVITCTLSFHGVCNYGMKWSDGPHPDDTDAFLFLMMFLFQIIWCYGFQGTIRIFWVMIHKKYGGLRGTETTFTTIIHEKSSINTVYTYLCERHTRYLTCDWHKTFILNCKLDPCIYRNSDPLYWILGMRNATY